MTPLTPQCLVALVLCVCATQSVAAPAARSWLRPGSVPAPAYNQPTAARIALGKTLFFDPRLSGSNAMSCSNCHNPALGWSDGQPTAIGNNMKALGRASPTLLNVAYNKLHMWDGRFRSLEEQALGPITAAGEMNQDLNELIGEIKSIPGYVTLFDSAYPGEGVTTTTVAKALAAYERTIVSTESPFDRWQAGNSRALDAAAKRGFELFKGKARCELCHGGFNFTDDGFHNIGLKGNVDDGRFKSVPVRVMRGAFKTPTLRDIALTAPYMHDGRYASLEEVVEHYDRGGDATDNLDSQMQALHLTPEEKADLVAFMKSLTGNPKQVVLPNLPHRVASTQHPAGAQPEPSAAPAGTQGTDATPPAAATVAETPQEPVSDDAGSGASRLDVYQMDKAFFHNSKRIVAVKVRAGEAVRFQNKDRLSHNLYSLSPGKTFDLGTMRKNQSRSVTFDRRGEVEVQCAIHPEMLLVVDVQ